MNAHPSPPPGAPRAETAPAPPAAHHLSAAPALATEAPADLRAALDALLGGLAPRHTAQAVDRLITHYRGETPTAAPVLRDRADVLAYAAYRMPATFEATRAALTALARALPADWTPRRHTDLGGGTGAAAWAAGAVWGGLRPVTVLDWAEPALSLGRELAATHPALRHAQWRTTRLGAPAPDATPDDEPAPAVPAQPTTAVPPGASTNTSRSASAANGAQGAPPDASGGPVDPVGPGDFADPDGSGGFACPGGLVTLSYVLGELTRRARAAAVDEAVRVAGAGAVVVVEPGTPDGYARIVAARDRLLRAGLRIAAPCPHDGACPIEAGTDWCHFSARVSRSSLHRQVKGGSLAYEDEKFSYVAAVHPSLPVTPAASRVLRRPGLRKGHVLLDLCTARAALRRATVAKRHGAAYRAARDTAWGDAWEPDEPGGPDEPGATGP